MNITDFTGVKTDSPFPYVANSEGLTVHFGDRARVIETIDLREGDYFQGTIVIVLPTTYPFGKRTWSERWMTIYNWKQDEINTVRIGIMCKRAGNLAIVSNRGGTAAGFHILDECPSIPPLGVPFELTMQAYLSSSEAVTKGYLNGQLVLSSSLPNIDSDTHITSASLGVGGCTGAVNQTATFLKMQTEWMKRL